MNRIYKLIDKTDIYAYIEDDNSNVLEVRVPSKLLFHYHIGDIVHLDENGNCLLVIDNKKLNFNETIDVLSTRK